MEGFVKAQYFKILFYEGLMKKSLCPMSIMVCFSKFRISDAVSNKTTHSFVVCAFNYVLHK